MSLKGKFAGKPLGMSLKGKFAGKPVGMFFIGSDIGRVLRGNNFPNTVVIFLVTEWENAGLIV